MVTLAGFAIGTLRLATMTTLHLRELHKTEIYSSERIFISCQPRLKKYLLQLGIHGDSAKQGLCKIMGKKLRYHYFQN